MTVVVLVVVMRMELCVSQIDGEKGCICSHVEVLENHILTPPKHQEPGPPLFLTLFLWHKF